jgi:hypothetical protein
MRLELLLAVAISVFAAGCERTPPKPPVVQAVLAPADHAAEARGKDEAFGASWLAPREVVQARVAKISVQFDW